MARSHVNVILRIMGQGFDPDSLSEELGIEAKETWRKGQESKNGVTRTYDCWQYETGYKKVYLVCDVLKEILSIFGERQEKIRALVEQWELDVSLDVVIWMYEHQTPGLGFDQEIIDFLHTIFAEIDIDMYIY